MSRPTETMDRGKTEVLEDKPVPVQFCLSYSHIDWPWIEPGPARWEAKLQETEWAFNVRHLLCYLYLAN